MHVLISALHRPAKPTGVCRHAANLAQCLVDTNEITKVTLLVGSWQHHYFEKAFNLCSDKINVISIDIHNTSWARNIWFLFGLPKLINKLCPDIVHLSFPMPFIRSHFSCPVISTIHDLYPYECPENFGRIQAFFNRLFLKICIQQSDGLTCVSRTTLDRFKFFFPNCVDRQELRVIYNIVEFDDVQPEIPDLFQEKASMPFLLSVAQHRKNKNLGLLIDAYAFLLNSHQIENSTSLIIVGSHGPETETLLRQIQDLKLSANIYLLAAIDDSELSWLYQHCKVFVMPSSTEGFCLPLAEALHLSCQVVCSDIPIFREIGSSDCTYFDLQVDPISNLANAILQVIEQPLLFHSNVSRFSRIEISKQYLQFYADILNTNIVLMKPD
jgi:glycosyltransferase involved in cell wall biosynthesis